MGSISCLRWLFVLPALLVFGCALLPPGYEQERQQNELVTTVDTKAPSAVSDSPAGWEELLRAALRHNGSLTAAAFEWRAALERVRGAASYPNTNLHLGVDYGVATGGPAAERVGVTVGNDPMTNLALPPKVAQAARAALAEARAAGERYRTLRLELQERVVRLYFAWLGAKHLAHLEAERLRWLDLLEASARARSGFAEERFVTEWARVQSERIEAQDRLARVQAEAASLQAELNALAGRPPSAPLALPYRWPARTSPAAIDDLLLRVARHPGVREREEELRARTEALRSARLQFLPDVNPMAALTGGGVSAVGGALVLPLAWQKLRAAVTEAEALLTQSRHTLAQEVRDRHAQAVASAALLADAERQIRLWEEQLLPLAQLQTASAQAAYRAGSLPLSAWAEAQNRRLAAQQKLVELRVTREQLWARLENLAGIELAPLAPAEEAADANL